MAKGKRLLAIIMICVLLISVNKAFAATSSGVKLITQDWAYQAIESLGQGRIMASFTIPAELNRNQGALLIARLLQHLSGEDNLDSSRFGVSQSVYLDSMIFSYNQRVDGEQELSATQVELLYRLVLEFQSELEILGYAFQDFNFLYDQGWEKSYDGLFAKRPLLYSEQALSAARKLEASTVELAPEQSFVESLYVQPLEPRTLWTGQASSQIRNLPAASSFAMHEPEPESNPVINIGGVELSGGIRPVPSGTQLAENSPATEGGAGYGISVKVGDLAVKTAVDHLATDESQTTKITGTSVDLSLDWSDLFTFSAGYKQLEVPKDLPDWENVAPLVTSVGLEVPITRGRVHLGVTQEWGKFGSEEGDESPDDESTKGSLQAKNIAELGLSYEFKNDSTLHFNYKFIDFNQVEGDHGASAAFSIKF